MSRNHAATNRRFMLPRFPMMPDARWRFCAMPERRPRRSFEMPRRAAPPELRHPFCHERLPSRPMSLLRHYAAFRARRRPDLPSDHPGADVIVFIIAFYGARAACLAALRCRGTVPRLPPPPLFHAPPASRPLRMPAAQTRCRTSMRLLMPTPRSPRRPRVDLTERARRSHVAYTPAIPRRARCCLLISLKAACCRFDAFARLRRRAALEEAHQLDERHFPFCSRFYMSLRLCRYRCRATARQI